MQSIKSFFLSLIKTLKENKLYVALLVTLLLLGIVLRFLAIDLRVLFVDEAVHYSFITELYESQPYTYTEFFGSPWLSWLNIVVQPYYYFLHILNNSGYRYDPVYHGPFIYYVGDLVFNLAGKHSVYLLRLPMVISSCLSLFILLLYREFLGRFGMLLCLILASLSPALVYFSNFANYEYYVAVFTLLGTGLFVLAIKKRSPLLLFLTGTVLLSIMIIKETAIVVWFCVFISYFILVLLEDARGRASRLLEKAEYFCLDLARGSYNWFFKKYLLSILMPFVVFGVLFVIFYASFGGNPDGVHDGSMSWMYWRNTGQSSGHNKPFWYYTEILTRYDFMLMYLFLTGSLVTLFTSKDRYELYLTIWAVVTWLTYSFIPYKTPWLILNMLLPFAIAASIGWNKLYRMISSQFVWKMLFILVVGVLCLHSFTSALQVKLYDYDRESNTLTYVHPYREYLEAVTALKGLIAASSKAEKTPITVAAPEYWPFPAYFFGHESIGYFGGIKGRDVDLSADIIINDTRDNPELRELLLQSDIDYFYKLRDFQVRPGVSHTIFVRDSLLERYLEGKYYQELVSPAD